MAGGKERILRQRIKSVQSTKKITNAMQLIAASRIAKAQARTERARPFARAIGETATSPSSSSHLNNCWRLRKRLAAVAERLDVPRDLQAGPERRHLQARERSLGPP